MFEAFGLPAESEAVYLALLDRPGSDPDRLKELDHAEEALSELLTLGLAVVGPDDRWSAVTPDVAIELLARRHEDQLRQARAAVAPLLARYRDAAAGDDGPVEVLADRSTVRTRFEQLVRAARHEVLGFDKPPYVRPVRDLGMELATLDRRVRFRCVYEQPGLTMPGRLNDVDRLVAAGEQARILPSLPFKLLMVDGRWAMLPVSGGTASERSIVVRPSSLFDALMATFDSYWRRGIPIQRRPGVAGPQPVGPAGAGATAAPRPSVVPAAGTAVRPARPEPVPRTSASDQVLLGLLATGLTDERIAAHLGLGLRTVQRRVRALMDRLGARNRFQAGLQAARRGLL